MINCLKSAAENVKGYGSRYYFGLFKTLNEHKSEVNILNSYLAIKNKYSTQFKEKNYEIDLDKMDALKYLKKLYHLFEAKIGNGNIRMKITSETTNRENIWMKPVFINDR